MAKKRPILGGADRTCYTVGQRPSTTTTVALKTSASDFRKTLRRSLFLTTQEALLFEKIPEAVLEGIFRQNFNSNLAMAERVLFNRYSEVDRVDRNRLEQEKQGIHNLQKAVERVTQALVDDENVLFVTDNDNDGSLAQAVLIEFVKALPSAFQARVHVEYAQPIAESRGITAEVVTLAAESRGWQANDRFMVVTADNGINSRSEQIRVRERYPNTSLIITDHHLPDENLVVLEDERTLIVNPKYYPTEYFQRKNISGANTLGVLLNGVLKSYIARTQERGRPNSEQAQAMANMDEIGAWANLLDYANAHMADMPTRPYVVEKALGLRPLLNVSNSMSNLITERFSEEDVRQVLAAAPALDEDWLRKKLADIATLNVVAQKLLNLYHQNAGLEHTFGERDFYAMLSEQMQNPENTYRSVNSNYIEQLRPVIFNLSAIDNKDIFMSLTADTMVDLYQELRRHEREILDHLRSAGLLRQDKRAHSAIYYPVDKAITRLFNRRLLGKAYNEGNNGFMLTLNSFDGQEVKGSMRSLYRIQDILVGKEAIEQKLGVAVSFQGHDTAAGFFVTSTNGEELSEAKLSQLNAWVDGRVETLKMEERINQMPNLELDFAAVGLATKINSAVKANLAGMWGLPTVLRFSGVKGDEVWVTDPKTTEQIDLAEVVRRKSYGYQAIATDFDGGAFVVPVELLRAVVESGYKKGLRLDYMDEGVFMGTQVVDVEALPNRVPIFGGRRDQDDLVRYYRETYKDSHFLPLNREDFRSSPYFRFNKHGKGEFELWESLVIRLLDETNRDLLAVIDTEGTGLGKAPKCFNLGGTNIGIDPASGKTLDRKDFENGYFRAAGGKEYWLDPEQASALVPLYEDEQPEDVAAVSRGGAVVLFKTHLEDGNSYEQRWVYPGSSQELQAVTNLKVQGDKVVYNRQILGFAFSFLVNNKDFAITKEFENLTGIGNWMVEKLGRTAAAVDKELVAYYQSLRNVNGEPARIIFQAHNMPYDKGVVGSNFQQLNQMMDDHLTSDTAKLARTAKLAYDDTPVSSYDDITGISPKAYFYDSPYSDYSLTTFLARCEKGKGGVFPDTTAKLLLRYNAETERFSIIDRKANHEIELDTSLGDLLERRQTGQLPNNAVRYSVERLSSRAMIRNIMLLDKPKPKRVVLLPNEEPFRRLLEYFQDDYHFDASPETNIAHFKDNLFKNRDADEMLALDLTDLAARLLHANRDLQARFHDGWIYEKVLAHYEPDRSTKRVPADVVEQVNYYTDLPNKKIRQVLDAVVRFNRHFGIDHAIVHEQHNNIRQKSEDGQGLSDTAYEAVLPLMLAMTKFYNPYYQSIRPAVEQLIEHNIQGSLVQHMLGDDFNNELARDSYSVTQMLGFRRQAKTDLVRQAQRMAQGQDNGAEGPETIKFKLPVDILPPGSAIYAKPKRALSQAEVHEAAEQLKFVIVNEQMKSSVALARNLDPEHARRVLDIAAANDSRSCIIRDGLLEKFESVHYSRKDGEIKKVSDMMKKAFAGAPVKLTRDFVPTLELVETAEAMLDSFKAIFEKMGREKDTGQADMLVATMRAACLQRQKAAESAASNVVAETPPAAPDQGSDEGLDSYFNPVRTAAFLPDVDIQRREPLKFALKHFGVGLLYPSVRNLNPVNVPVVPIKNAPKRRRATPTP